MSSISLYTIIKLLFQVVTYILRYFLLFYGTYLLSFRSCRLLESRA